MASSIPRRHAQQGMASLELALLAPLLVTLLLGAAECGRAVLQYNAAAKNVRSAVRYLSNHAPGDTAAQAKAKNLLVYGSTTAGSHALVPGLDTVLVEISDATTDTSLALRPTGYGVVNLVKVQVRGLTFQPLASWILPSVEFATIAATMRQGL